MSTKPAPAWQFGLRASLLLHLALVGLALWIPYRLWFSGPASERPSAPQAVAEKPVAKKPASNPDPEKASEKIAAKQPSPPVDPHAPVKNDPPVERVQAKLAEMREAVEKLSDEQKRDKLQEYGQKLESISSPESLSELAGKMQGWLGTKARATEPTSAPPPGAFQSDSAQIHTVKRTKQADQTYQYTAVLVDAEGRSLEVPLARAQGEQLYQTFQIVEANPLLNQVYRSMAMPLLDQILSASSKAGPNRPSEKQGPSSRSENPDPSVPLPLPSGPLPLRAPEPRAADEGEPAPDRAPRGS